MKEQADPYGRGSYCIVVAMHGDQSQEAEVLREFRDTYLKGNLAGEKLVDLYYRVSPKVNSRLAGNRFVSRIVSGAITSFSRTVESFML